MKQSIDQLRKDLGQIFSSKFMPSYNKLVRLSVTKIFLSLSLFVSNYESAVKYGMAPGKPFQPSLMFTGKVGA